MELKINSNQENRLLNRREIMFSVEQDGSTPSKVELVKEICKKLNLSPDSTIIVRVDQGFGRKESSGVAHSYSDRKLMEKSEPKHITARSGKGKADEQKVEGEAAAKLE
jgi:ribosomal protein S24E